MSINSMNREISNLFVLLPVPDDSIKATQALISCAFELKRTYLQEGFAALPTRFIEPDVIVLTFLRESKEVRIHLRPV